MRRSITALAILGLAASAATGALAARGDVVNARIGSYAHYGVRHINLRLDKIQRVAHIDGGSLAKDRDPGDGTKGYIILSFSEQNAAGTSAGVPGINVAETLDDQSTITRDTAGPFVGAGRTYAPIELEGKQTVHFRVAQFGIPADRTITKIIVDPDDGGEKLRYTVTAANVELVPDVPRASPAP